MILDGVTVCSVMVITTILYMCVMRYVWHNHWIRVTLFGLFLLIDLFFLSANVMKFFEGAWVALLVGVVFFFLGFAWYYGQSLLRRYLHCYAQTTALPQLANRLGLPNDNSEATQTEFPRSRSFEIDHQTASSDEDDDDGDDDKRQSKPIINVLPPMNTVNNGLNESLEERQALKENHYRTSATGNVLYTVTPGLGVFLTTSSRHTPHVFERVLAQIHAVTRNFLDVISLIFPSFSVPKWRFFSNLNMLVFPLLKQLNDSKFEFIHRVNNIFITLQLVTVILNIKFI